MEQPGAKREMGCHRFQMGGLGTNSGGIHYFMSFSKIFQLCTHARITKCGSREKELFVRHVFLKKFRRTAHIYEFFINISTLYPC